MKTRKQKKMINIPEEHKHSDSDHTTFIDLFCGVGGFKYALESFNARCVFSSEIDHHARETYFQNFNEYPSGDITKIDVSDIPPHDILCAGFPCQAFSIAGNKEGLNDTRGQLFNEIIRVARYHQPKVLLLENVPHLLKFENGSLFEEMKRQLFLANYKTFHAVLDASEFGVAQARKRLYIVAFNYQIHNEIIDFELPIGNSASRQVVNDILEQQPIAKITPTDAVKRYPANNPHTVELFTESKYYHNNYQKRTPTRVGWINGGTQGERVYKTNCVGMTMDTHRTGLYETNSGIVRELSAREQARMNGLPEHFVPNKIRTQAIKQAGNGVVVNVLQSIYSKVKESIFVSNYENSLYSNENLPEPVPLDWRKSC